MKALSAHRQMKVEQDIERVQRAMAQQDYDAAPPRCATCVYFRTEPLRRYAERTTTHGRTGKVRTILVRIKAHPSRNPLVDRCTFGNFLVKSAGVCNEWHSREGERIAEELPR